MSNRIRNLRLCCWGNLESMTPAFNPVKGVVFQVADIAPHQTQCCLWQVHLRFAYELICDCLPSEIRIKIWNWISPWFLMWDECERIDNIFRIFKRNNSGTHLDRMQLLHTNVSLFCFTWHRFGQRNQRPNTAPNRKQAEYICATVTIFFLATIRGKITKEPWRKGSFENDFTCRLEKALLFVGLTEKPSKLETMKIFRNVGETGNHKWQ